MSELPARKDGTQADALAAAVSAIGGQAAMARLLGVAQPSVWRWMKLGRPLPAEHVLTVERETGVSKYDLRPDIYQREAGDDQSPSFLRALPDSPEPAR